MADKFVLKFLRGDLIITDNDATLLEHGNVTTEGIMIRVMGETIQLGSPLRDQDLDIVSTGGRIHYDAGLASLQLTTTQLIQSGLSFQNITPTVLASAAGYTMTAAQLLSGLIIDATNTGAIAVPFPTVAATVALIPGYAVGTCFYLTYVNTGNQTVTVATDASTQWTMTGTMTILTTTTRVFLCRIDSAVTGTVYSLGTFAN